MGEPEAQDCFPLSGWVIDLGEDESHNEACGQEDDYRGCRRQAHRLRADGESL